MGADFSFKPSLGLVRAGDTRTSVQQRQQALGGGGFLQAGVPLREGGLPPREA